MFEQIFHIMFFSELFYMINPKLEIVSWILVLIVFVVVIYIGYTESSGQAKLNINLMVSEYIIIPRYNCANIANKITITALG